MAVEHSIAPRVSVAAAQELWSPAGTYLNTASYGLPPQPGWDALQAALADWHGGRTSWEGWGEATEGSRTVVRRDSSTSTRPRRGRMRPSPDSSA